MGRASAFSRAAHRRSELARQDGRMTDISFRVHPSPVGEILIVAGAEGIVTLHPIRRAARRRARPCRAPAACGAGARRRRGRRRRRAARRVLRRRAARVRRRAGLDDSSAGSAARRSRLCARIPYGETAGYGEVAISAGSPGAARAVGTACATTPFSIIVPVHRVVRADGSLGEYGGRPEVKRTCSTSNAPRSSRPTAAHGPGRAGLGRGIVMELVQRRAAFSLSRYLSRHFAARIVAHGMAHSVVAEVRVVSNPWPEELCISSSTIWTEPSSRSVRARPSCSHWTESPTRST